MNSGGVCPAPAAWAVCIRPLSPTVPIVLHFASQWYKREVDPDFDVDWVAPRPAAAAASAAASAAAGAARGAAEGVARAAQAAADAARSAAAGAAGRGAAAGASARASPTGELVLLVAHVAMLVTAVLSLQPLSRFLAWQAYFMFCRTALVASGYKASAGLGCAAGGRVGCR